MLRVEQGEGHQAFPGGHCSRSVGGHLYSSEAKEGLGSLLSATVALPRHLWGVLCEKRFQVLRCPSELQQTGSEATGWVSVLSKDAGC